MRKLTYLLLLVSFLIKAQDYKISPWFEQKKSAVILTFDDAYSEHYNTVIPLMNTYDFEGTFYINKLTNYGWTGSAIAEGHEIGNHTESHPNILELSPEDLKQEVSEFRDTLIEKTGYPVSTFAYPFGAGSETSATSYEAQDTVANKHIAGRGVYSFAVTDWVYDFAPDARSYFQLPSLTGSASNWYTSVDNAIEHGGMINFFYHAIGNPGGFDNVSIEDFTAQLDYLQAKNDSVWVTTLANSMKYHRERKTAELTEVSAPFVIEDNWRLELSDSENDAVYDQALTIELEIPTEITAVVGVKQNGVDIPFHVEGDTVYFNAVPDAGNIDLSILNCVQPTGSFTTTGTDTFCLPNDVNYAFYLDVEYDYTWYKNDVEYSTGSNSITVSESGVYHLKVELEGCPLITAKKEVLVTGTCGVPHPGFTVNRTSQFKDEVVIFNSTSTNLEGSENYYWDFGDGASKSPGYYGEGPIEVTYSVAGLKDVSLTVEGSLRDSIKTETEIVEINEFTACHAFKTDFSEGLNPEFLGGWHDYHFSTANNTMRIITHDNGGNQWYIVKYAFNDGIEKTPLDFSDPLFDPVLHFRIKASDSCRVAVHLVDENGKFTAGMTVNSKGSFDVTTQYQEFTMDFNELFFHQWNDEDVDSTKITEVAFTINSGFESFPFTTKYGKYIDEHFVGNVDIDWISVGENCKPDSLFGNIVLPHEVAINEPFEVWNYSNPGLVGAIYEWNFGEDANETDLVKYDEEKFSNFYTTAGVKTVSLKITKADGEEIMIEEHIRVLDPSSINDDLYSNIAFINPFEDRLFGEIYSEFSEDVQLVLYDIQGRIIIDKIQSLELGKNIIDNSVIDIQSGFYMLSVVSDRGSKTVKLKH